MLTAPYASLLGRAYKFKGVADYGVGSQAVVTAKEAQDVIDIAHRLSIRSPIAATGREPPTRTTRSGAIEVDGRTAYRCTTQADRVKTHLRGYESDIHRQRGTGRAIISLPGQLCKKTHPTVLFPGLGACPGNDLPGCLGLV